MGDSLDHLSMKTEEGGPFDVKTTMVTTGDQKTYDEVFKALDDNSLSDYVNLDSIPQEFESIWSFTEADMPRTGFVTLLISLSLSLSGA